MALIASWAMASLRPAKPRIRNWHRLVQLILIVLYDIVRSNLSVAKIILFRRERDRKSGFLAVPLDIRDPMALAVLATILTSTPGSAWRI